MFNRLASGLLGLAAFAATGHASTYTFSGVTGGGKAVSVQADFTVSAGQLSLVITNNTANIVDVSQSITDMFFNIGSLNLTGTTLFSITGNEVIVASDGTTTVGSVDPLTQWALEYGTGAFPTEFHLNDLGGGNPELAIIGPPTAGVYSSANGSIAGNAGHNPFYNTSATFTIKNANITANTAISNVWFSFGTTAGDNHQGCIVGTSCTPPVPEPITSGLVGTGLVSLFFLRRRVTGKA